MSEKPILPSFREILPTLKQKLAALYDSSESEVIAERIIEAISGMSRSERLCHAEKKCTEEQWQQYLQYEAELLRHRPLQYVLGKTCFYGLELKVNESVLIPRPETEELVDFCLKTIRAEQQSTKKTFRILDIGTGSGCIALALKKHLPQAQITAVDFSTSALDTAQSNAQNNHLSINFLKWDILKEPLPLRLSSIDVIISNPPYITAEEKNTLHANVLNHEPQAALFVTDKDPLQFYKKIESVSQQILNENGSVFLELHETFAQKTEEYFRKKTWETYLKKDFQKKDRMLLAKRNISK